MQTNSNRLPTVRLSAMIQPAQVNSVVRPDGTLVARPGQGGVVLGLTPGSPALGWESDHLEPGASLEHPDPAANRALQILSCVGNVVTVCSGAAIGAEGRVLGKHGAVLVQFPPATLTRLRPGDEMVVNTRGVGLRMSDEPQIAFHSCAPELVSALVRPSGGNTLTVPVRHALPAKAAGAGSGLPSWAYNIDLDLRHAGFEASVGSPIAFGDIVALTGHDHRFGREYNPGWSAFGVIAHGTSAGGGHGVGLVTLVSGPLDRIGYVLDDDATISMIGGWPW